MSSHIARHIFVSFISLLAILSSSAHSASYSVNPGDVLDIAVWNEELLSRQVLVRPDGFISLPMAGEIDTTNSSPSQVSEKISQALGKYMKDVPQVVVSLITGSGNKIFVIGKVIRPGEYIMGSETDVVQALALAGGLNTFADTNDIIILRRGADGVQTAIPFEYSVVEGGKELHSNIILQSRDIVVVP